ncbi:MAG: hypothetical protein JW834_00815 [Candidatus Diapherotrites archaeon]|nr:hypothetical protein [Candidatus Diapherotrites archaeon]
MRLAERARTIGSRLVGIIGMKSVQRTPVLNPSGTVSGRYSRPTALIPVRREPSPPVPVDPLGREPVRPGIKVYPLGHAPAREAVNRMSVPAGDVLRTMRRIGFGKLKE